MALLTDKTKKAIQALYEQYEVRDSTVMPALHLVQEQLGHLSKEAITELSHFMEIPEVKIDEVVQFYTMYHQKPVGKFHFQICRNITCSMFDSTGIREEIKKCTGLNKSKEITSDGLFSYEEVECLGACGTAPVVMINDSYYESFSKEKVSQTINHAKNIKIQD
jgi:NADH-quinone oxidoreductase subunit E